MLFMFYILTNVSTHLLTLVFILYIRQTQGDRKEGGIFHFQRTNQSRTIYLIWYLLFLSRGKIKKNIYIPYYGCACQLAKIKNKCVNI